MAKAWKTISWESCDRCGDDVEVLTTADGPDMVYDSDEARCVACRCPGNVSCDGESCYIVWHSDADCDCRYCQYWEELDALREENERLKAVVIEFLKWADEEPGYLPRMQIEEMARQSLGTWEHWTRQQDECRAILGDNPGSPGCSDDI